MTSVDSNILLYAQDASCPEHDAARGFLVAHAKDRDFAVCELALVELYVLLRNPALLKRPLKPAEAVQVVQGYRSNRHWHVIEHADGIMRQVWQAAGAPGFPRRRIFDARLALSLTHHGITEFATRNVHDFRDFGFTKVWDPISTP